MKNASGLLVHPTTILLHVDAGLPDNGHHRARYFWIFFELAFRSASEVSLILKPDGVELFGAAGGCCARADGAIAGCCFVREGGGEDGGVQNN